MTETGSTLRPVVSVAGWSVTRRRDRAASGVRGFACVLLFILSTVLVLGQGNYTVLQTGAGQPMTTSQQILQTGGLSGSSLVFNFGFYTGENATPGAFLDSLTVTIQDPSMATAILVTADASGFLWAPASPGSVSIPDSTIERTSIIPPSLQPIAGQGVAFSVRVPLPAQFAGPSVTAYFDLFDNMNQVMSLGWYNDLRIVFIPEPGTGGLLVLGGSLLLVFRRRRQDEGMRT